jgi:hypothetical protein
MSEPNRTQHDVGKQHVPSTGGDRPVTPDPSTLEQGSKNPDVRDKADRASNPTPPDRK